MKISLVMLESLNGKIAKGHKDDLMWGGKADKKSFSDITKKIGTIIAGSTTFEDSFKFRALPKRRNIILSRTPEKYAQYQVNNLEITNETPQELVERLEKEGLEEAALIGGGKINSLFFQAGLVDEIYLTVAPQIYTNGVDLVDEDVDIDVLLELKDIVKLDENAILLHYLVNKHGTAEETA